MAKPKYLYYSNGLLSVSPRSGSTTYTEGNRLIAAKILLDGVTTDELSALTGYSIDKCRELLDIVMGDLDEIL